MPLHDAGPVGVAVLGSTGSIGRQALDVIARSEGAFKVVALCAGRDDAAMAEQIERFAPRFVAMRDPDAAARLRERFGARTHVADGEEALVEAACYEGVDIVLVAVVGFAGVAPTLAALKQGRRVALANKETLVAAGELVMAQVGRPDQLLPVDSEHAALFQILDGRRRSDVHRVILTASGGPFRRTPLGELRSVRPEQALQHPTWRMGAKITVDSATLMNKGFEVIEAVRLFGLAPDRVAVLVHPQSVVHALVEFGDGSLLAQMAVADMRLPIAAALWYPRPAPSLVRRLDLAQLGTLSFEPPDPVRFPCLGLAYAALQTGGTMPAVLNAANEVAVAAFLAGRIGFLQIPELIERVMAHHRTGSVTLEAVCAADRWARAEAERMLQQMAR